MSRLTEREIARRLSEREDFEPPAGLLEKIKSEIPPSVKVGTVIPGADRFRRETGASRQQKWLIAASVVAATGAGLLTFQLSREMPTLEEAASQAPREEALDRRQERPGGPPPAAAVPAPKPQASLESLESAVPPPPPPPPPPMTRKEEQRLRALGYTSEPSQPVEVPESIPYGVEGGVEGGVPGGVVGGVVGGVAGGAPGGVVSYEAAPAPPPPLADSPLRAGSPRVEMDAEGVTLERRKSAAAPEPTAQSGVIATAGVDPFVDTAADRLSTFGLDVDTGSYTLAQRSIADGVLPQPESVRVEELVNFFDYGDAPPSRGDFALRAEGAPSPFAPGSETRFLRFNVKAREVKRGNQRPVIAKNAKAQVELNPAVVSSYRLIGYENRAIADHRFRDETVDAGEVGAGHSVTALYEVKLRPDAPAGGLVATLRLRYRSPETGATLETERKLRRSDLSPSWENASPALRFAASVAEFAEILRGSSPRGSADFLEILKHAQPAAKALPESEKAAEFLDLVRRAAAIAKER